MWKLAILRTALTVLDTNSNVGPVYCILNSQSVSRLSIEDGFYESPDVFFSLSFVKTDTLRSTTTPCALIVIALKTSCFCSSAQTCRTRHLSRNQCNSRCSLNATLIPRCPYPFAALEPSLSFLAFSFASPLSVSIYCSHILFVLSSVLNRFSVVRIHSADTAHKFSLSCLVCLCASPFPVSIYCSKI